MKTPYLLLLTFLFLTATSFKTDDELSTRLYKPNERLLFSFQVSGTKKYVSVSKDKTNKYIVYRYGTKDNVELQYPEDLGEDSWNRFMFYYVGREGTAKDGAFQMLSFSFVNKGSKYDIFHNWNLKDSTNDMGINITERGAENILKFDMKTQLGSMQNLRTEKNIKNSAGGE